MQKSLQHGHTATCNPVPDFIIRHHVRENLKRGLPHIALHSKNEKTLNICCGGPSLQEYMGKIGKGPTLAVNGSGNYLKKNGVKPDFVGLVDPLPWLNDTFEPINGVIYLVASQVHPEILDKLRDYTVVLWHASTGPEIEDLIKEKYRDWVIIGGGSSIGSRTINIGYVMGFRRFNLYGFDCSFVGEKQHAYSQNAPTPKTFKHRGFETNKIHKVNADSLIYVLGAMDKRKEVDPFHINVFGNSLFGAMIEDEKFSKIKIGRA